MIYWMIMLIVLLAIVAVVCYAALIAASFADDLEESWLMNGAEGKYDETTLESGMLCDSRHNDIKRTNTG